MSGSKSFSLYDMEKYTNWFRRSIEKLGKDWNLENLKDLCDVIYFFVLPHADNLSDLNDHNAKLIRDEILGMFNIIDWTEEDKSKLLRLCKSVYTDFEEYNNIDI